MINVNVNEANVDRLRNFFTVKFRNELLRKLDCFRYARTS